MMQIKNEKGLFIAEYSMIGAQHVNNGKGNQDSLRSGQLGDNVIFCAVADGVSSAKYANVGSLQAVQTIEKISEEIALGELDFHDYKKLQSTVVRYWKDSFKSDWNEYATTLNFLIFVNPYLILGQIGDGLICVNIDGTDSVLTSTEEFYTTETAALSEVVYRKDFVIQIYPVKSTFSVAIMTDGIGKEIPAEARTPLEKYLNNLSRDAVRFETELIPWVKGLEGKNGDDKSIIYVRWEEM